MSAIDEVKQKTDIVEIVSQYVTLKKSGRNLTAPCPFHSEKIPSFFVYPEQQSWHCFGACATGGDVFSFIMKKEGLDFGETLRLLADRAGVTLPSYRQDEAKKEETDEIFKLNEAAAMYFHNNLLNAPAAEKARKYVEKRGYTPRTVADFTLGYSLNEWEALKNYLKEKGYSEKDMAIAGLLYENEDGRTTDRFRGKLMIPLRDSRGRVTGFGARVLDDSLPKYVNSPQTPVFDKSSTLYAIDRAGAEIRKQDGAIVMEGYMDVITAHQNGISNAVASMGTAITETQVNILKKLSRNLILAMDADTAGEEAMLRTIGQENTLGAEIKVIALPEGKDPDDIIREDMKIWQSLVNGAVPLMDYLFEKTTSRLDLTTARDKSAAANTLGPVLNAMNDPVRQAHYIQKLAGLINVDVNTVRASLGRMKQSVARRRPPALRRVQPPMASNARPLLSGSREEYCLALLLQHPALKKLREDPSPYFEYTENREIFHAWQTVDDISALKDNLDPSLHEHLDVILKRQIPPPTRNNIEQRYADSIRELKKQHLKKLVRIAEPEEVLNIRNEILQLERQGQKRSSARR